MRVLMRAPALLARVLGVRGVAPAGEDNEGWYTVRPGALYWCRDEEGRESYVYWDTEGGTYIVSKVRAELWAALLEVGAQDAEAERMSR